MIKFTDWLKEKELTEMPRYIDHEYLDFKPMKDLGMTGLEKTWQQLEVKFIGNKKNDSLCFVKKSKSIAVIGLTVWDDNYKCWNLEVASYVKLEKTPITGDHYKVIGVFTKEDYRLEKYTLTLYYTLIKNGIKLCSDNEQYQGAKYLWKALSRITPIEIYDELNNTYKDYSFVNTKDEEVWSKNYSKYDIVLRSK
jgi:hypothetical protein